MDQSGPKLSSHYKTLVVTCSYLGLFPSISESFLKGSKCTVELEVDSAIESTHLWVYISCVHEEWDFRLDAKFFLYRLVGKNVSSRPYLELDLNSSKRPEARKTKAHSSPTFDDDLRKKNSKTFFYHRQNSDPVPAQFKTMVVLWLDLRYEGDVQILIELQVVYFSPGTCIFKYFRVSFWVQPFEFELAWFCYLNNWTLFEEIKW